MQLGAIYPQYEMPADASATRDFILELEAIGFSDLGAYDHVLGADWSKRTDYQGDYDYETAFHEPLTLFAWAAGFTSSITFTTCIIILPQRQTALVAKQAADLAILSGNRLRLGVGIGWNPVEYEGLGQDFRRRGARMEEQVPLLRELWSKSTLHFDGKFDRIVAAGIKPRPTQPIPIWFGGTDERALRRAARLGDGWFPDGPIDRTIPLVRQVREFVRGAGRDPNQFGIEPRILVAGKSPAEQRAEFEAWRAEGIERLSVTTLGAGFTRPEEHLAAMRSFYAEFGGR